MVSMVSGKAVAFSLANLQERGILYIGHGTEVYEGMVVGNVLKGDDMSVNPTKGKQLTNMRASGTDEAITLNPVFALSIERGLEVISWNRFFRTSIPCICMPASIEKFLTITVCSRNDFLTPFTTLRKREPCSSKPCWIVAGTRASTGKSFINPISKLCASFAVE